MSNILASKTVIHQHTTHPCLIKYIKQARKKPQHSVATPVFGPYASRISHVIIIMGFFHASGLGWHYHCSRLLTSEKAVLLPPGGAGGSYRHQKSSLCSRSCLKGCCQAAPQQPNSKSDSIRYCCDAYICRLWGGPPPPPAHPPQATDDARQQKANT